MIMKELSIEEKAKRYDEAIEQLRTMMPNWESLSYNGKTFLQDLVHIIPELTESKDERMIQYFKDLAPFDKADELYEKYGFSHKDAIAWLEKQGHVKESQISQHENEICKENDDSLTNENERIRKGMLDAFKRSDKEVWSDAELLVKDIVAWLEKQESVGEIVSRCKTSWYNEGKIAGMSEGLTDDEKYQQGWHDALEKQGEQKPTEWSEEDEKMFNNICIDIVEYIPKSFEENSKKVNWLKSLKGRVQPQNKWINVDEEVYVKEPVLAQKKDKSDTFGGFVVCCDHTLAPNVYERYMILGNTVSQNKWKPSDEQLLALRIAIGDEQGSDCCNILRSLLKDLKNL